MKRFVLAMMVAIVGGVIGGEVAGAGSGAASGAVPKTISGRCHCGAIRYVVTGPAVRSSTCDCEGCRRASGALKVPYVTVSNAVFKVTAGVPSVYRAVSGEKCDCRGAWNYCATCGSPLFWKGDQGGTVDLFAGSLDDPTLFHPNP